MLKTNMFFPDSISLKSIRNFFYKKSRHIKIAKSFTLIEVLVSAVLIAIVSAGAYSSFVVVSRAVEDSRNRSIACDLAERSLEEVRTQAHTDFDTLESHTFSDLSSDFPGFNRSISISPIAGSSDFKKVDVTVNWPERGTARDYHLALLLSRSPEPLPGNIEGTITDSSNGNPVANANVTARHYDDTTDSFDISYDTTSDSSGKYTFAETGTGGTVIFRLKPGQWEITVTHPAYHDYTYSAEHGGHYVDVYSSQSTTADISLDPLPTPAHIKGRFIGSVLSQYVSLYQGGSPYKDEDNNNYIVSNPFDFKIDFTDTNQECFTVITGRGTDPRYYPHVYNHHCTHVCSPYGTAYNYRGWSSAQMNTDGSERSCANPWLGSNTADYICVNPGQTLDLGDIRLIPVPMATLKIHLIDNSGSPIKGEIYIWERRSNHSWRGYYGWAWTNAGGFLQKDVPAEQDLLPNSSGYYIVVRGRAYVQHTACCDTLGWQRVYSSYYYIGPLHEGDTRDITIQVPAANDYTCGDARGYVRDGKTLSGINNVNIYISGYGWKNHATNGSGYYEIKCHGGSGCAIVVGTRRIIADKGGYYPCDSTYNWHYSNNWYNPSNVPEAHIVADASTLQSPIYLWPKGYGTIKGRVVDASGGSPISGAKVTLHPYSGGNVVKYTNGSGRFTFNGVIETWPPPGVVGNNYYNQTGRRHSVTVEKSNYDSKSVGSIELNAGQTSNLGDIKLTTGGGV